MGTQPARWGNSICIVLLKALGLWVFLRSALGWRANARIATSIFCACCTLTALNRIRSHGHSLRDLQQRDMTAEIQIPSILMIGGGAFAEAPSVLTRLHC